MRLGIFAKTFVRPTLPEILAAVSAQGLDCVQFNLACVGRDTVPAELPRELAEQIGRQCDAQRITMAAVSGTFNLIHPDRALRQKLLANLAVLAGACQAMGTRIITLCTGTCDPVDMWKAHPDNGSRESWRQLVSSLHTALELTASTGVTLAIEPEPANVVDSAAKALALLEEIDSPRLKIILDGANLVHGKKPSDATPVLRDAIQSLSPYIVIAHAKDLEAVGPAGTSGKSHLDYVAYLRLLVDAGFTGPLILHGMTESQVPDALEFLRRTLRDVGAARSTIA